MGYTYEELLEDGYTHQQIQEWLEKEREEAAKSYPEDEPFKFCYRCNQLMKYDSMAYHEGYHFDSCY